MNFPSRAYGMILTDLQGILSGEHFKMMLIASNLCEVLERSTGKALNEDEVFPFILKRAQRVLASEDWEALKAKLRILVHNREDLVYSELFGREFSGPKPKTQFCWDAKDSLRSLVDLLGCFRSC